MATKRSKQAEAEKSTTTRPVLKPTGQLELIFDAEKLSLGKGKSMRDGLSVVAIWADSIWVANDETTSIECLHRSARHPEKYEAHATHKLDEFLKLPVPADGDAMVEADIEGVSLSDGYLWFVGSHSYKRKEAKKSKDDAENLARLAKVSLDGNRCLLGRIPLAIEDGFWMLKQEVDAAGENDHRRKAGLLKADDSQSELTEALADDEHLKAFLKIPGKENGFDIEGLAVSGKRIFVGLRGPVLRGRAVVLELAIDEKSDGHLHLEKIGEDGEKYRKHFLNLDGLGVRELSVDGEDLIVLAGPTMALSGPVRLYRWVGGNSDASKKKCIHEPLRLGELPHGDGEDHAEGLALLHGGEGRATRVVVAYDSAAAFRKPGPSSCLLDVFELPTEA